MAERKIRPIRIEGNLAYITLTKGYEAIIDASDIPAVAAWNWCVAVEPCTNYARRTGLVSGKSITMLLHRFLLDAPDGMAVDHANGDGLDNRRCNLRLATTAENVRNQRISNRNTSGLKGVSWHKAAKKWRACIQVNGKQKQIGHFATAELAHHAYCYEASRIYGKFARFG
jgi:hypothetical protein